jgi:hypothetical protein
MNDFIKNVRDYAIRGHNKVNQKYGKDKPYSVHLEMIYETALDNLHLIPIYMRDDVLAACFTHDLLENTFETYNNILNNTNIIIAELTYALTNEKGRNRKEKANSKYYKGIRKTKYATFIKLCDRIANVEYSKNNKSSMFKKYKEENVYFIKQLSKRSFFDIFLFKKSEISDYSIMIGYLDYILHD